MGLAIQSDAGLKFKVLKGFVWRERSAQVDSTTTMWLKEVADCLEVLEDEGVDRVGAERGQGSCQTWWRLAAEVLQRWGERLGCLFVPRRF